MDRRSIRQERGDSLVKSWGVLGSLGGESELPSAEYGCLVPSAPREKECTEYSWKRVAAYARLAHGLRLSNFGADSFSLS